MRTMVITKDQIINAVLNEPLKSGRWIHDSIDNGPEKTYVDPKTCPVCAVGAVLRSGGALDPDTYPRQEVFHAFSRHAELNCRDAFTAFYVDDAWEHGTFFDILSAEFEWFCDRHSNPAFGFGPLDQDEVRLHLLSVIEAACPEALELQLEDAA